MKLFYAISKNRQTCSALLNLFLIVLLFSLSIFGLNKLYGPLLFADEYGYWLHAAFFSGKHWSVTCTSWYSFAYSLFLTPLFIFFNDMVVIYRAAIIMNGCFLIGIYVLCYKSIRLIDSKLPPWVASLIAFCTSSYSSYLGQAKIAWSEIFVYFSFWLSFFLFARFIHRQSVITELLLGFSVGLTFWSHNRCAGIVIAFYLVILLMLRQKHITIKQALRMAGSSIIMIVLYQTIKTAILSLNPFISSSGNSAGYMLSLIAKSFSLKSILAFLVTLLGHYWYCNIGSFFIFGIGVVCAIKTINNNKQNTTKYLYLFALLCSLMMFFISAEWFNETATQILFETTISFDNIFYGRYIDTSVGPLLMLGFYFLFKNNPLHHIKSLIINALFVLAGSFIIGFTYNNHISPFYNLPTVPAIDFSSFVDLNAFSISVFTFIIAGLLLFCFSLIKLNKKDSSFLAVLLCFSIPVFFFINVALNYSNDFQFKIQNDGYKATQNIEYYIEQRIPKNTSLYFLDNQKGWNSDAAKLQCDLVDYSIIKTTNCNTVPNNSYLLLPISYSDTVLDRSFCYVCAELSNFYLIYYSKDSHSVYDVLPCYEFNEIPDVYESNYDKYSLSWNEEYRIESNKIIIPITVDTNDVSFQSEIQICYMISDTTGIELYSGVSGNVNYSGDGNYQVIVDRAPLKEYLESNPFNIMIYLNKSGYGNLNNYVEPISFSVNVCKNNDWNTTKYKREFSLTNNEIPLINGELVDNYIQSNGKPGIVTYGPYVFLNQGKYELEIPFDIIDGTIFDFNYSVVASTDVITEGIFGDSYNIVGNTVTIKFDISKEYVNQPIEFILSENADARIKIYNYTLKKID